MAGNRESEEERAARKAAKKVLIFELVYCIHNTNCVITFGF
jgi:hypothetical protein